MRSDLLDKEQEISRRWAPHYDRVFSDLHNEQLRSELVEKVLSGRPRGPALILDIGAGPGCLARAFARAQPDARVIALDISADVLLASGQQVASDCVVASAEEPPFAPGTFDAVVGYHVLHHLDQIDAVVLRALELLQPGGCLCFIEPAENELERHPWATRAMRLPFRPVTRYLRRAYADTVAILKQQEMLERSDVHHELDQHRIARLLEKTPDVATVEMLPRSIYSVWLGSAMYGDASWERPLFAGLNRVDRALLRRWPQLGTEVLMFVRKRGERPRDLAVKRDADLRSLLVCPRCRGPLVATDGSQAGGCRACRLVFGLQQGLPNLLLDRASTTSV